MAETSSAARKVWVRVLTWAVALVLPVVVVASALAGMEKFRSFDDRREERNAGSVLNGRVMKGGIVGVIEKNLAQNEPAIVLLGNSLANTNLNIQLLAKRLDLPARKVQRFSVPNSMAAHWYAITKNRVYENGHRPDVILILSDLQSLLALDPRSEASYLNLAIQLGEDEPFIDEKLGARNYYLERVRENRGKVRDRAMMSVRNSVVDLLLPASLQPSNDREIGSALERVFDASKTDMRLHNNVIPIYNSRNDHELVIFDPASLAMPEDSFLGEIARMAHENGGRLVYIRPPMSPLLPEGIGDIVLPEHEAAVQPLMSDYGGVYLDLRDLDMDVSHFTNADHMNGEGARRFTEIVSELFADIEMSGRDKQRGAELLKSVALVDGGFAKLPLDLQFKDPPPEVPRAEREWSKGRGRMLYFDVENFEFLHDARTMESSPHASRCSPLRVLQDGQMLPHPNETCDDVLKQGMGRTCHTPDRLYFTTSDNSNPFVVRHKFKMALDPARACDGGLWLYPNDRVRITLRPYDVQRLPRGASVLSVLAADLGSTERGGSPVLGAKVRAAGTLRLDAEVSIDQLASIGATLRLDQHIAAGAQNVQVELYNKSDRFLLLKSLVLDDSLRARTDR